MAERLGTFVWLSTAAVHLSKLHGQRNRLRDINVTCRSFGRADKARRFVCLDDHRRQPAGSICTRVDRDPVGVNFR